MRKERTSKSRIPLRFKRYRIERGELPVSLSLFAFAKPFLLVNRNIPVLHQIPQLRIRREVISPEATMAAQGKEEMRLVLQVGSTLRVRNNGDVIIDNPELELSSDGRAADAVLLYRFDSRVGEHVFRLLDPVADHQHMKHHRRDD